MIDSYEVSCSRGRESGDPNSDARARMSITCVRESHTRQRARAPILYVCNINMHLSLVHYWYTPRMNTTL